MACEVWSHHPGHAGATAAAWATWRAVQAATVPLCTPCHPVLEAERERDGELPFRLDKFPEAQNRRRGVCRCSVCVAARA